VCFVVVELSGATTQDSSSEHSPRDIGISPDFEGYDFNGLESAGVVRISVRDSGVGLSVDNINNLFLEGVQFNPNQLQDGKGSGLGLWVSKGFAVNHGGTILATSDGLNTGSVFTLELPAYMSKSNCSRGQGMKNPSLRELSSTASPSAVRDVETGMSIAADSVRIATCNSDNSLAVGAPRVMGVCTNVTVERSFAIKVLLMLLPILAYHYFVAHS
jgi:hypothetical protein